MSQDDKLSAVVSTAAADIGSFIRSQREAAQVSMRQLADKAGVESAARIQWLIDTPERLTQYLDAAQTRGMRLRANFEIDVGLHRGGFSDPQALAAAVRHAQTAQAEVAGLMGYDPHVPKMPSPDKAYSAAQAAYGAMISVLKDAGLDPAALTLNSAGSPTFRRHCQGTVANEVSVGSAFVKPGDFDLDDLADLQPAAFIATPVLKASPDQALPGIEALSGAMHWWDRNTQRGFFVHGGHWLAEPFSPPGLQYSKLFGRSSNQELLTGSKRIDLKPDDLVFLRPDQSEALFLQFGDIAVYEWVGPPGAILSIARDPLWGWRLEEARLHGNETVPMEARGAIMEVMRLWNVSLDRGGYTLASVLDWASREPSRAAASSSFVR